MSALLRIVTFLAISMALLCLATPARADGDAAPAAEALFLQGRDALARGDYAEACAKFGESLRLDPAPGTALNLSECEEHTGKLAQSWQHLRQALEALAPTDERIAYAQERLRTLEPRVPKLTLRLATSAPPGTRVHRDGLELGPASLGIELPVDPGLHTIEVTSPGRPPRAFSVTLAPGEVRTMDLEPAAEPAREPATVARRSSHRTLALLLGGAGLVAVGVGTTTGVLAIDRNGTVHDHCSAVDCDAIGFDASREGKTYATVSTISFVGGAALLAAGLTLFLVDRGAP